MARRRSLADRWTSMVGWMTLLMGSVFLGSFGAWAFGGRSGVAGQPQAAEGPSGRRWEEVPVGGAEVVGGRHAGAAAQHVLVDHELAVVLADRPGGRLEARVGTVGGGRPLPDVAEQAGVRRRPGDRVWMEPGLVEEVPRDRQRARRHLPLRLGGQPTSGPAGEGVGLVVAQVTDRLGRIDRARPGQGELLPSP